MSSPAESRRLSPIRICIYVSICEIDFSCGEEERIMEVGFASLFFFGRRAILYSACLRGFYRGGIFVLEGVG